MASAITAKCPYCGENFDRIHEGCYKIPQGKRFRYAHINCFEQLEDKPQDAIYVEPVEEIDRTKVTDYIQEIFGDNAKWSSIGRTITSYLNKGYNIDGIYNALYYWYTIKGNSIDKARGNISIVEYVYEDAKKYFTELEQITEINEKKEVKASQEEIVKIKYNPPKRQIKCYLGKEMEVGDIEF